MLESENEETAKSSSGVGLEGELQLCLLDCLESSKELCAGGYRVQCGIENQRCFDFVLSSLLLLGKILSSDLVEMEEVQQFQTPNFDMSPERVTGEIQIHPFELP
jgi:hypothetical protein